MRCRFNYECHEIEGQDHEMSVSELVGVSKQQITERLNLVCTFRHFQKFKCEYKASYISNTEIRCITNEFISSFPH